MKTTLFFLLCAACVIPNSSVETETRKADEAWIGPFSNWWGPANPESPKKEEVHLKPSQSSDLLGDPKDSHPNAPEETVWNLLHKLNTLTDTTLGHVHPGMYMPETNVVNKVGDVAANARENVKQKAREEMCEIIKTCLKGMFWG